MSNNRASKTEGHFLTGLEHDFGIGLNVQEIAATLAFIEDEHHPDFSTAYRTTIKGWDVTPYEIFLGYYRKKMPYGTQKASTGDPYTWLHEKLRQELGVK